MLGLPNFSTITVLCANEAISEGEGGAPVGLALKALLDLWHANHRYCAGHPASYGLIGDIFVAACLEKCPVGPQVELALAAREQ